MLRPIPALRPPQTPGPRPRRRRRGRRGPSARPRRPPRRTPKRSRRLRRVAGRRPRAVPRHPPGGVPETTARPTPADDGAEPAHEAHAPQAPAYREPSRPGPARGTGPVFAAVDVGANSTHLLVARVADRLEPLIDESALLGLGAAVYAGELIPPDVADAIAGALRTYLARAAEAGAQATVVLGTEPFRRAANAARVVTRIVEETGVPFHVLRHEEEGLLTLLGATRGRPLDADVVVADIGGGSSEIVVAGPGRRPVTCGLRLGSAHASARHVEHDPPSPGELLAIQLEASEILATAPDARPDRIVLVGGTASNLLKVAPRDGDEDGRITRDRLAAIVSLLIAESADVIAEAHAIRVQRARILGAGAAIVDAILDRYGLEEAVATDEGIREGAVIARARAGAAWRDALPRIVGGV